jgi:hypothetical protein
MVGVEHRQYPGSMRRRRSYGSRMGEPPMVELRLRVPRDLVAAARARAAREQVTVGVLLRNLLAAVLLRGHESAHVDPPLA